MTTKKLFDNIFLNNWKLFMLDDQESDLKLDNYEVEFYGSPNNMT